MHCWVLSFYLANSFHMLNTLINNKESYIEQQFQFDATRKQLKIDHIKDHKYFDSSMNDSTEQCMKQCSQNESNIKNVERTNKYQA